MAFLPFKEDRVVRLHHTNATSTLSEDVRAWKGNGAPWKLRKMFRKPWHFLMSVFKHDIQSYGGKDARRSQGKNIHTDLRA